MADEIVMRCPQCGQRYDPNPAGRAPITCGCGVGWAATVTFTETPDGAVATGDIEYELHADLRAAESANPDRGGGA